MPACDAEGTGKPLLRQGYAVQGGDFLAGGTVSTRIKDLLKEIGLSPALIRRAAICCYEAEMNVVMYARQGTMTVEIHPRELVIRVEDEGPGIPDVELAMQEGYSTATDFMRSRGFGAGMGLPNIRRNADLLEIESVVGRGTSLRAVIRLV
ncbi:MAG: anti-sigma regulatory factor [Candidatus Zixiibacteriota bacterium]|nr:MAG: anti-sigma regulatory factor [candidate division Zixibacteria bacterium]